MTATELSIYTLPLKPVAGPDGPGPCAGVRLDHTEG